MPSTQKFDGPVLADLLAKVGTLGAGARILKAEKKRSGGLGGFFAKEWFELTVEVPDRPTPAAAPAITRAASIVEMAEAVSATERRETFDEVLQRVGSDTHLAVPSGGTPTAEEFVAAAQARLAALPIEPERVAVIEPEPEPEPEAQADPEPAAVAVAVAVSAVADQNRAALASVPAGGPPAWVTPVREVPVPAPAPALVAQVEVAVVEVAEVVDVPEPAPEMAPVPVAATASSVALFDPGDSVAFVAAATAGLDRDAVAELVFGGDIGDDADADDDIVEADIDDPPAPAPSFGDFVGELARMTESAETPLAIAGITTRPRLYTPATELPSFQVVMRRLAQQADMPLADRWSAPRIPESTEQVAAGLVPALLALGVPDYLLLDIDDDELTTIALPQAPTLPTKERSLVAVVGDRAAARRVARSLASDLGRGENAVVMATAAGADRWTRDDILVGRGKRRRYRLLDKVIAIPGPAGPNVEWASELLDALEPDMVWGVVDADRKCEDVAAWSDGLGGIDVLALEKISSTVTPGAILGLGIPVGRIDGEPASPELWADLLTRRLAVAA